MADSNVICFENSVDSLRLAEHAQVSVPYRTYDPASLNNDLLSRIGWLLGKVCDIEDWRGYLLARSR